MLKQVAVKQTARGRIWAAVAVAALWGAALAVGAETNGWYLGGGVGLNELLDAENRSQQPAEGSECTMEIPGSSCVVGSDGDPDASNRQFSETAFDLGLTGGLSVGFGLGNGLRPELSLNWRGNDLDSVRLISGFGSDDGSTVTGIAGEMESIDLNFNMWYDFLPGRFIEPYVGAGLGSRWVRIDGGSGNAGNAADNEAFALGYQVGAGAAMYLLDTLALTVDLRYFDGASPEFRTSTGEDFRTDYHGVSVAAGLRWVFAPTPLPDGDGDGVPDVSDKCPGTRQGISVDAAGCAFDSDGDGVADHRDKCPDTPAGAQVNRRGCEKDSDRDKVSDSRDKCPGTPRGTAVDADGCELDSDGDGVRDSADECPGTPAGEKVDQRGCELSLVLQGVNFEFDSAALTAEARGILDQVAVLLSGGLVDRRIEVAGHTDFLGSESYNESLSLRRAKSVKAYLVERGVSAERLLPRGYGTSQPVADNDTEEGRQANRRVVFTVLDS